MARHEHARALCRRRCLVAGKPKSLSAVRQPLKSAIGAFYHIIVSTICHEPCMQHSETHHIATSLHKVHRSQGLLGGEMRHITKKSKISPSHGPVLLYGERRPLLYLSRPLHSTPYLQLLPCNGVPSKILFGVESSPVCACAASQAPDHGL